MNSIPPTIYGLSRAEIQDIEQLLASAEISGDRLVHDTKVHLLDSALAFGEPSDETLLSFIGILAERPQLLQTVSSLNDKRVPPEATGWGEKFLLEWLAQFRRLVCGNSAEYKKANAQVGSATKAAILVLVPTLMKALSITEPHAVALGIALFVGLSSVTKHAICSTLDAEVAKRLRDIAKPGR